MYTISFAPDMMKLLQEHTNNLKGIWNSFNAYLNESFDDLQKTPSKWVEFECDITSENYTHEDGLKLERFKLYTTECGRFNAAVLALVK